VAQIHPTAQISPDARLAEDVTIGPYAIIDGPAVIGPGCEIGAQVWIHGEVSMGAMNKVGYGSILGADPQDLAFEPATTTGVVLGEKNVLREYVTIHRATEQERSTTIGNGNFLMTGVHLGHDVVMGDRNTLANNALLAGFVEMGDQVVVGGGCAFHQFIMIGDHAMVQGLTGASKDIAPFCTVGQFNRLAGINSIGMRRGGIGPEDRREIKAAYKLLFREGLALGKAVAEADSREWGSAAQKLIEAVRNPSRKGVVTREG
jgi:UDP-N-acetylglucosamine acyltransferase